MGVSEKGQVNKEGKGGRAELVEENQIVHKKWVISGIQVRGPLKPLVFSSDPPSCRKHRFTEEDDDDGEEDSSSTTPTSEESRIESRKACPPPPRKWKPTSRGGGGCSSSNKDFFCPPDLDTVFIRRHVA